jgi:hypothetical protein
MRQNSLLAATVAGLLSMQSSQAITYNDATGDTFFGGILDITSVEVSNDATDLLFKINLVGDISAADWGNYMVAIDSVPGGDTATPVGNPWNRPISMSQGMDYWLGSWVNGGGGRQLWKYTGSWNQLNTTGVSLTQYSVSFTAALSDLGLNYGDTFSFDVFSSGATGDPGAVDSLANPNQTIGDWGNAYVTGPLVQYTVVPEPGTLGLTLLGGLAMLGFAIRRRS